MPGVAPEHFAAWLAQNRAQLRFSDVAGHVWRVDAPGPDSRPDSRGAR